jgi:hypothetical protein
LVEKPAWTSYYSLLQLAAGTNEGSVPECVHGKE